MAFVKTMALIFCFLVVCALLGCDGGPTYPFTLASIMSQGLGDWLFLDRQWYAGKVQKHFLLALT